MRFDRPGFFLRTALFVLVGLQSGDIAAQWDTRNARWEVAGFGGFLAPHRASMRALITEHARGASITWSTPARGLWSCYRGDARWGFTANMGRTGAPDHLGAQAALLGFADMPLAGPWRFRLCGGLGWTQKTWSEEDPSTRQRVVIGSPINGSVQIGIHLPPLRNARNRVLNRLGFHLTLDHQSNASFTQPNLGTNVFRVGLSTGWPATEPIRRASQDTTARLSLLPGPVKGWQVQVAGGRRQPAPLDARENTAELSLDRRFGGQGKWGYVVGGMGLFRPGHSGIGIHAGFQIRFTRVQVDLVHGRYPIRWQEEEGQYNRVVFQWHLSENWWGRIALHTHGFRAHHPALGVGYVIRGGTPYAGI